MKNYEEETTLLLSLCLERKLHIHPFNYSDKGLVSDICKGIRTTISQFPELTRLLEPCIWAIHMPWATHFIIKDEWVVYCGRMPEMLAAVRQINLEKEND